MHEPKITFFMITTDTDIVIADYAVRSFSRVRGIPFRLRVLPNWISAELRRRYVDAWRRLPYVDLVDTSWQNEANRPNDRRLDGPFESYDTIWDRELRRIETPYLATADADFEILDGSFIAAMLEFLDGHPRVVAMSTDYSPTFEAFESYSGRQIRYMERWHTWFCIYKREALRCEVSHAGHIGTPSDGTVPDVWDSAARFQQALREGHGFELAVLDGAYQRCFIHYGAFSKNRQVHRMNVGLYRRLQILKKVGWPRRHPEVGRSLATRADRLLFGHVDRSRHLPGWGVG